MKKILKTYILTFLILIISLFLVSFIPKKAVYKNTVSSFKYYYNQKKIGYLNNNMLKKDYYKIDYKADMKSLSMAYEIDEKDKINSLVKMNYIAQTEGELQDFSKYLKSDKAIIINYSRYWQGQTIFLRILLIFFNIQIIYFIGVGFFSLILIFLTYKLLKKDKLLGISFIIGNILINFFIIPYCIEYIFAFLISYISCIVLIKMIDRNSKNISLLFLINGMLVAFFDFLTCETITLSLPLFIYIYLTKDKITYKDIFKIILLWTFGYAGMFIIKWSIAYALMGKKFIKSTAFYAKKRIYFENENTLLISITNIGKIIKDLFIFNKFKYGLTLFCGVLFYIIYNIVFNNKNKKLTKLLFVSLIPILRYILLPAHTYVHGYFVYRAILPLLIFITVYIVSVKKSGNLLNSC
ncbi:MAG: hypothetical protein E7158_04210 [Firmicutes bacterium]|nr:hypothetical protein [Bacillota bacterium]